MPYVKVGTENSADIEIHDNDHGTGKPIVLIHGYPLDANSWERQERVSLARGVPLRQSAMTAAASARPAARRTAMTTTRSRLTCKQCWTTSRSTRTSCSSDSRWAPARSRGTWATAKLIADLTVVEVEGGPHNIGWPFPDEVDQALLDFL